MNDKNWNKSAKDQIRGVHCDVANCEYNDKNCNCFADNIVVGPTHASKREDTICATFKDEH